jgi:hypothetical protein
LGEEFCRRWRMVVWHFRLVVPKGCRIEGAVSSAMARDHKPAPGGA